MSRSPHGLRGLKLVCLINNYYQQKSQPAWAAWIEIEMVRSMTKMERVAARMGCVD